MQSRLLLSHSRLNLINVNKALLWRSGTCSRLPKEWDRTQCVVLSVRPSEGAAEHRPIEGGSRPALQHRLSCGQHDSAMLCRCAASAFTTAFQSSSVVHNMAAFQLSRVPGAVCPPPVCPCHATSFQQSLTAYRQGGTPNIAAASYACHQRRSGRVAASDKERQYRADFEKRIEEEDAAVEAEAAPSMEAQLQALRSQGPPPGMSPEDFEKEMAQYEQAMQDPAVRAAAQRHRLPEQTLGVHNT